MTPVLVSRSGDFSLEIFTMSTNIRFCQQGNMRRTCSGRVYRTFNDLWTSRYIIWYGLSDMCVLSLSFSLWYIWKWSLFIFFLSLFLRIFRSRWALFEGGKKEVWAIAHGYIIKLLLILSTVAGNWGLLLG